MLKYVLLGTLSQLAKNQLIKRRLNNVCGIEIKLSYYHVKMKMMKIHLGKIAMKNKKMNVTVKRSMLQ